MTSSGLPHRHLCQTMESFPLKPLQEMPLIPFYGRILVPPSTQPFLYLVGMRACR